MTVPNLLLKKKGLHLAHVNVCSLRNKTVDLEYLLSNNNVHIMGISETHLDASVRDGELQIPNYDIIRLDRNGRGGGVAFYIRNHIPYKQSEGDILGLYRPQHHHRDKEHQSAETTTASRIQTKLQDFQHK
ncbi:hypothetical protein Bbelb_095880 [Branchiostoma belcheri]|nr:hypothetical protein Bbelb_095880 [Branchiostoma belcheri]